MRLGGTCMNKISICLILLNVVSISASGEQRKRRSPLSICTDMAPEKKSGSSFSEELSFVSRNFHQRLNWLKNESLFGRQTSSNSLREIEFLSKEYQNEIDNGLVDLHKDAFYRDIEALKNQLGRVEDLNIAASEIVASILQELIDNVAKNRKIVDK